MKKLYVFGLILLLVACKSKDQKNLENKIVSYHFNKLEPLLHQQDDRVHVVNFWATWCVPCVEELPYFKKLEEKKDVDLLLVSMDIPIMKESHLVPFVAKNDIQSKVILLDDPNGNVWIPKVDENWDGAIPATLIYTNEKRKFYKHGFISYDQLLTEIENFEQ